MNVVTTINGDGTLIAIVQYCILDQENGGYIRTGESVGIVMDTSKDELSFFLNGMNLGVAYEGIVFFVIIFSTTIEKQFNKKRII